MFEITTNSSLDITDKEGRFAGYLSYAANDVEADRIFDRIKAEEKDAAFHCYARRVLHENGQVYIKRSDGSGSSGKASAALLATLVDEQLVNVVLTISAYTDKLPSIGLYKKLAAQLIERAGRRPYSKRNEVTITVPHNRQEQLISLLESENINLIERSFAAEVTLKVEATEEQGKQLASLAARCGGRIN